MRLPVRYLPEALPASARKKQKTMLLKSRNMYKKHQYYTRKPVAAFKSRRSKHLSKASKIYGVTNVEPNATVARKTGCSMQALRQIVRKGEGAYYSSGSRPNQTAQSWGLARLASSLTSGKAAAVDYRILEKGCDHRKTAFRLAKEARRRYGFGLSKTRKVAL